MERLPRKIYTYEFKLEAVRLVGSGQSIAEAARSLGVVEQTLGTGSRRTRAGSWWPTVVVPG
jgi:transposase